MADHDAKVTKTAPLFAGSIHLDLQLFMRHFFSLIWGDTHTFQVEGGAKREVRSGDRFHSLL